MKKAVLFFGLMTLLSMGLNAQKCNIKLEISEVKKAEGDMIISVFDNEDDWLEKSIKNYVIPVKETGRMSFQIEDIKKGKYALAIIHDLDKNGRLNSNMFGPPSEPYGFSRNARGFMGPAKFEDAAFELTPGQSIEFKIKLD